MIDYDPHSWMRHFFDVKGSMVREIVGRVLLCVACAVAVTYVHLEVRALDISEKAHSLIGLALGLLLVFRTNSSYDRFWEGRKQWGAIVNECRNVARLSAVLLREEPAIARALIQWTIAFAWSTLHQLRGGKGLGESARELPPEEIASALAADHLPLAVATKMSAQIERARAAGRISDYQQMAFDQNVALLVDYMGACERIHKTPLPFAYVVHLRRALLVYCLTLPFALVATYGWVTIAVTFVIAYTLFGIEEIGVEIEDPFGLDDNDLPLERICENIERNLRSVLTTLGGVSS